MADEAENHQQAENHQPCKPSMKTWKIPTLTQVSKKFNNFLFFTLFQILLLIHREEFISPTHPYLCNFKNQSEKYQVNFADISIFCNFHDF